VDPIPGWVICVLKFEKLLRSEKVFAFGKARAAKRHVAVPRVFASPIILFVDAISPQKSRQTQRF
jgi:hypothetical protein